MISKHRMLKSSILMSSLSLTLGCSIANAETIVHQNVPSILDGTYIGIFGGGGHASNTNAAQNGTAFFPPAAGGPLAVHATGDIGGNAAIVGAHIGYQWLGWVLDRDCLWRVAPAAELEGYYLHSIQQGDLINPTTRLPEHSFVDSFPIHAGVFLANAVFTLKNIQTNDFYPYVGIGIGAAHLSIRDADSSQVAPAEPGINHFNSNPSNSDWAFAAQGKAGFSFKIANNWRLFTEYRLLYVASSSYTFGSTVYPTHVPTTNWNVNLGHSYYNMGDVGIEYSI